MRRLRGIFLCYSISWLLANMPASPQAQSLHLVECDADGALAALLEAGLVVSHASSPSFFVYGDERVAVVARRLGCASRLLDAEIAGWEHYLVAAAALPAALAPPLRLVSTGGGEAVVAVPAGGLEQLLALDMEVRRLFPRPLRRPGKVPPPERAHAVSFAGDIAALVAQVSGESLLASVARLQAFGSRNSTQAGGSEAAAWLAARFRSLGIEQVQIRAWSTVHAGNVVATLPGAERPQEIYLLGGHFDSIAPGSDLAPGADDNASGTATLLEIARLLATQRLASTVRLVAFSGEEYGLLGSEAYAATAAAQGENIVAMLNFDMLGHVAAKDRRDLDLITNDWSQWLLQSAQDVAATYVPGFLVLRGKLLIGRSDHESFWAHGYPALFYFEDSTSPSSFIHTADDVIGLSYNDTTLHVLSTRVALAQVATLAGASPVALTLQDFAVEHRGGAVGLQWRLAPESAGRLQGVTVQRAARRDGPWEARTATPVPSLQLEFVDVLEQAGTSWWYRLRLEGHDGPRVSTPPLQAAWHSPGTGLDAISPAAGAFQIRFHVGAPTRLHLGVYDVNGRLWRTLASGAWQPGQYLSTWDRRDPRGVLAARGIYVVSLRGDGTRATRKFLVP